MHAFTKSMFKKEPRTRHKIEAQIHETFHGNVEKEPEKNSGPRGYAYYNDNREAVTQTNFVHMYIDMYIEQLTLQTDAYRRASLM